MNLFKSIATFGGFTLLSRFTGFFRDMVLANYLGAGLVSDAFFVSFKLPNLFRSLFAEGAFTSAFVPMLSQKLAVENKKEAVLFAARAISVLAVLVAFFVIIVECFMPEAVNFLAPGFSGDKEKIELATELSRITFPFLLFISIVSFQSGILTSMEKFAAPAAAPIILNLTMIASVFVLAPFFSTPAHGIALGISIAGILEMLCLNYFLRKQGVYIKLQFNLSKIIKTAEIKTLFKRIVPGIMGAGIYQINMVVDTILVSMVGTGAISWLYYANRLQQLPLGVVGAAISVAVLPVLSKHIKNNDIEKSKEIQTKAVEYGAILSIPSMVALIILAEPIVNILFQHGKFGAEQTYMTALAVMVYAIGLPAYVMVKAVTPNFFARGDTKTPVKYSAVVLGTNVILAVLLMGPFGHVGIASATTIAAYVSLWQYIHGLKKRKYWVFSKELVIKMIKIIFSSVIMGLIIILCQSIYNNFWSNWLHLTIAPKVLLFLVMCIFGFITFLICVTLLKVINFNEIIMQVGVKRVKHGKTTKN